MKDLGLLIAFGNDKIGQSPVKGELFLQDRQKGIYNYRFTDAKCSTEIRIYKNWPLKSILRLIHMVTQLTAILCNVIPPLSFQSNTPKCKIYWFNQDK